MAHHSDAHYRLTFEDRDGRTYATRADGESGYCIHYDADCESA